MHKDLDRILLSEKEISEIVERIAKQIDEDYKEEEVEFVVVLKGSMLFASDLMRKVNVPLVIDFIQASSYGTGSKSTGEIIIKHELGADIKDKNIIIIEDIVDSGNTLFALKNLLLQREPKSIKICAMLNKQERREADLTADYIGAEIPDEFVVGYGLDYAEKYRELPYIGILSRRVYE